MDSQNINGNDSSEKKDTGQVETNMGTMSMEDYLDIKAMQYGFEDYADMKEKGFSIAEAEPEPEPEPEPEQMQSEIVKKSNTELLNEEIVHFTEHLEQTASNADYGIDTSGFLRDMQRGDFSSVSAFLDELEKYYSGLIENLHDLPSDVQSALQEPSAFRKDFELLKSDLQMIQGASDSVRLPDDKGISLKDVFNIHKMVSPVMEAFWENKDWDWEIPGAVEKYSFDMISQCLENPGDTDLEDLLIDINGFNKSLNIGGIDALSVLDIVREIKNNYFPVMTLEQNPIASVEELEEVNYNMIDGMPNNGFGEKEKDSDGEMAEHLKSEESRAREQEEKLMHEQDTAKEKEGMIFALTGAPVSQEMLDAIERLQNGNYVPRSEIDNIEEIKTAYSILRTDGRNTNVDLASRKPLLDSIYKKMENITSAVIDENGKTSYNGDVSRNARLDIIIGLPASGKSSTLVDPISSEFHSRLIDNDEAKKAFPEFNDGWGSDVVHKESQMVCDKLFINCLAKKENIVLPKVGSDSSKLINQYISKAKARGYEVYVHYADLDRNKALGRMLKRFCETGRFLAPALADRYAPVLNGRTQNNILDAYEALKTSGLVDGFTKWNNDVVYGEKPVLLENIGCKGNFIDNARKEEREGQEHGGYEILGERESGTGSGGYERSGNDLHNEELGEGMLPSGRNKKQIDGQAVRELPAAGNHGNDNRGSAEPAGEIKEEREGQEHGGYEILGERESGTGSGGHERTGDDLQKEEPGTVPESFRGTTGQIDRHTMEELQSAGNHGNDNRGSAEPAGEIKINISINLKGLQGRKKELDAEREINPAGHGGRGGGGRDDR